MLLCRELKTRAMAKRKFFQEKGKGNPILRRKVLTQFSFSKTYHTSNKSPALKTKFELHILSHLCLSFPKVISNNFFYHFVTIRQEGWSNITNLNDLPLFFLFFWVIQQSLIWWISVHLPLFLTGWKRVSFLLKINVILLI